MASIGRSDAARQEDQSCPQRGERIGSVPSSDHASFEQPSDQSLEDCIAAISQQVSSCPVDRLDEVVSESLGRIGEFFEADAVALRISSDTGDSLVLTHRWLAPDSRANFPLGHELKLSELPWLHRQLMTGEPLLLGGLAEIPSHAKHEREMFRLEETRAASFVPSVAGDRLRGGLYIRVRRSGEVFSADHSSALSVLVEQILSRLEVGDERSSRDGIIAPRAQRLASSRTGSKSLGYSGPFEALLAQISASFISVPADQIDPSIEDALAQLGQLLEVDRITVRLLNDAASALVLTHCWSCEFDRSDAGIGNELPVSHVPFLYERLRDELIVELGSEAGPLPQARVERRLFGPSGHRSSLAVPVTQSSGCIGILYVTMRTRAKVWSEQEKVLLRYFSSSLANVLQRRDEERALRGSLREKSIALSRSVELLEQTNISLERASSAKSRFLSTMSHELRTPMNSVIGYADMLSGEFFGDLNEKQQGYVAAILSSGGHLLRLLDNLLEVNSIDAGEAELDLEEFEIAGLVDASVAILRVQAERQGVHVEMDSVGDIPAVKCDGRRISQILVNLLNNALKYTHQGGRVVVRLVGLGDFVRIEVADTGIGITQEHQESIFEEFEQVDRSRDEALGGIGMGLPLSRRLVELHGGEIGLDSSAGTGATFWFTLPAAGLVSPAEVDEQPGTPVSEDGDGSEQPLILVAEDNQTNLILILDMLDALGFRTLGVSNGQEAVEAVEKHSPALVLMDVRMPVMDGLEATRAVRALPNHAQTPVVALTANAGGDYQRLCFDAGCRGFLTKPVRMASLSAELVELLGPQAGS